MSYAAAQMQRGGTSRRGGSGAAADASALLEAQVNELAGVEQVWYKHATEAWARGRLIGNVGGTMVRVLARRSVERSHGSPHMDSGLGPFCDVSVCA